MASSLFALLDDIATVLDDIALMTQTAAKKTAGVLGDDLALNAQQVAGVQAERELPVVWAVARGSLLNKAILVPAALLISAFAPWAVTPLLMIGGAYLCYEGFEKLAHRFLPGAQQQDRAHHAELTQALADPAVDFVALEREKIRGAIRTDFILSAEIIVISLGAVAASDWSVRIGVLCAVAVLMTVGVYGLVAAIVKLDDLGLHWSASPAAPLQGAGRFLLRAAPWLMKFLSVAGTAAMFLVGGSILLHGIGPLHHALEALWAGLPSAAVLLLSSAADALLGVLAGALVLAGVTLARRLVFRG